MDGREGVCGLCSAHACTCAWQFTLDSRFSCFHPSTHLLLLTNPAWEVWLPVLCCAVLCCVALSPGSAWVLWLHVGRVGQGGGVHSPWIVSLAPSPLCVVDVVPRAQDHRFSWLLLLPSRPCFPLLLCFPSLLYFPWSQTHSRFSAPILGIGAMHCRNSEW